MKQLTLRGFGKELERRIRDLARREGISLNQAAVRILRRGAGLEPAPEASRTIGTALDRFFGTWSEVEYRAIEKSLRDCERIDGEFWR